jgi:hypothetical protein
MFDNNNKVDNDFSFRMIGNPLSNIVGDNNDINYGAGGMVALNGRTAYDTNNNIYPKANDKSWWNNYNKYVLVYVKFADQINAHKYIKNQTQVSITLGSTFMNRGFTGYMGDVIFLNTNHTVDDQRKMEGYLAWKWGLQDNLSGGKNDNNYMQGDYKHPYLNSPPYL